MTTLKTISALALGHAHALEPVVLAAAGRDLDDLLHHPLSRQPGVYITLWVDAHAGVHGYAGTSGDHLRARLTAAPYRLPLPIDRVIAVVDRGNRLTRTDAAVLERLAYQASAESGVGMIHDIPHGAVVSDRRYQRLRQAWTEAAQFLKAARLLFVDVADRAIAAGPSGNLPLPAPQDAPRYVLHTKTAHATASVTADGWRIEPGSVLAAKVSPHAAGVTRVRRQEWLYCGALEPHDGRLIVRTPLAVTSASAAARMVLGHAGGSPSLWRPITDDPPRPMPDVARRYVIRADRETVPPTRPVDPTACADLGGLYHG